MSKIIRFVFFIALCCLVSCAVFGSKINSDETIIPKKPGFIMSNLDNELEVRVYDLKYLDDAQAFILLRPRLPRAASLQFVTDKNMLVYADQSQRIPVFERLLGFLDSASFYEEGLTDHNLERFAKLLAEQKAIAFTLSQKTAQFPKQVSKNWIQPISGDDYDKGFGQHFERWFGSCIEMKVMGRVHVSVDPKWYGDVISLYTANAYCIDNMNGFMAYLRTHENTDIHLPLLGLETLPDGITTIKKLRDQFPALFSPVIPEPVKKTGQPVTH